MPRWNFSPSEQPPKSNGAARAWLGAACLVVLPLLAYSRLIHAGFIWDDDTTLTGNPLVHAANGLRRIWFTSQATDYWPVTFSTFWGEWRLWGMSPAGYHATNVLLHGAGCVALWRLFVRIQLPAAFFAALIFALHPLNVESVAWIAERKNLLALLFFVLSLRAFAESSATDSGRIDRWCLLAWAAFALSLLSKGSTAPLPLVLAGWVRWRRKLRWRDAGWLALFAATAAAAIAINLWFAHRTGHDAVRHIGWAARVAGAGGAFWFYLGKMLLPFGLCFVYPGWVVPPLHPIWWVGVVLAIGATAVLWAGRRKGWRPDLGAWLYCGVMLLPVLGFTDVYFMQYSLVADHYAHLALIGFVAWCGWRFAALGLPPATGWAAAAALGLLTFQRTAIYRDNTTLYTSILADNPECWLAHNNLGLVLMNTPGRIPAAIAEFEAALRAKPDFPEAHNDLGAALMAEPGRVPEAIGHFQAALRLLPNYTSAHNNLGNAWLKTPGHAADAVAEYREAIRLRPDYAPIHFSLAIALLQLPGRGNDAAAQLQETLRLAPDPRLAGLAQRLLDRIRAVPR